MSGSQSGYRPAYRLSRAEENIHRVWDNSIEPALTVQPGGIVRFECRDPSDGQLSVDSTVEDLRNLTLDSIPPLTGPVSVEGAEPGDVLEIELLDLQHKGWGWTGFWPGETGFGLLPDDFPDPELHVWDLEGDVGHFKRGIEVPLDPFPGTMGVAPGEDGKHDTSPPRHVGGNVDIKHLTEGAKLYLPVEVDGALFSVGDCHGAQGDGEVCQTAIEAPMFVTARFDVHKDKDISQPRFETSGPFGPEGADERMFATSGVSSDLMEASRIAMREMIDHLSTERDLTRGEAYMLCSTVVDLKVNEVVDDPNWVVSAYVPKRLFED